MKTYVFATNNPHKLEEVRQILAAAGFPAGFVRSLADIGCRTDIPETADSIEGNALLKARYIHAHYGCDCFADDTGLEVAALHGAPGVYSARYAGGAGHDDEANRCKLLHEMQGVTDRRARFRTVVALIEGERERLFEGVVNGSILEAKQGEGGFGYDPLFLPDGYTESFAALPPAEKNCISHRGRAIRQMAEYLKEETKQ
jgi:XTP/dITP diphosphohydrolase